jgi:hypothetical protein
MNRPTNRLIHSSTVFGFGRKSDRGRAGSLLTERVNLVCDVKNPKRVRSCGPHATHLGESADAVGLQTNTPGQTSSWRRPWQQGHANQAEGMSSRRVGEIRLVRRSATGAASVGGSGGGGQRTQQCGRKSGGAARNGP